MDRVRLHPEIVDTIPAEYTHIGLLHRSDDPVVAGRVPGERRDVTAFDQRLKAQVQVQQDGCPSRGVAEAAALTAPSTVATSANSVPTIPESREVMCRSCSAGCGTNGEHHLTDHRVVPGSLNLMQRFAIESLRRIGFSSRAV
jgi:hypothetical protein